MKYNMVATSFMSFCQSATKESMTQMMLSIRLFNCYQLNFYPITLDILVMWYIFEKLSDSTFIREQSRISVIYLNPEVDTVKDSRIQRINESRIQDNQESRKQWIKDLMLNGDRSF